MERFAREWWLNLDDAMSTDTYMDTVNIHRFDPPSKYRGGAGVTGLLEEGAAAATIDKCVCVCADFQWEWQGSLQFSVGLPFWSRSL